MIAEIGPQHHDKILELNAEFVHWLSPLDRDELLYVLARADYARQISEGAGALIGYAYDVDYPNHGNMTWLKTKLDTFFYIDRIIVDREAQGQSLGRKLNTDIERYARSRGHVWLACEVNTVPNNPGSLAFHLREGFAPLGEQDFPNKGKAVRYYAKALN